MNDMTDSEFLRKTALFVRCDEYRDEVNRLESIATKYESMATELTRLRAEHDALVERLREAWSRVRTCCKFVDPEHAVLHDCCDKGYGTCAADLERVLTCPVTLDKRRQDAEELAADRREARLCDED